MNDLSLGILLAGGRSTRMGRDKAILLIDGEPLWRRQARTLSSLGAARIVASRQHDQPPLPGLEAIPDDDADLGPLSGLHAGLRLGAGPLAALLAIDMPGAGAAWFAPLLAAATPARGAVYRNGNYFEPLAALYPLAALDAAARRIAARTLSMQALCEELGRAGLLAILDLPATLRPSAANLNDAADSDRWGARP